MPAEVWSPPGFPNRSIDDANGHPLTWGTVRNGHAWLVRHAYCEQSGMGPAPYASDDDGADPSSDRLICYCQTTGHGDDERMHALAACESWPGPICGSCWAASCDCGYVYEAGDSRVTDVPAVT